MDKTQKEKDISKLMIELYCKKNHKGKTICNECKELIEYSNLKAEKCPFKATKTFCSKCTVHCYKPAMRNKIKAVMRFSGPRMIFHHPIMLIKHITAK